MSLTFPAECIGFEATPTGTNTLLVYRILAIGDCSTAVTFTVDNPNALPSDLATQYEQAENKVLQGAVAALTAACGAPSEPPTPVQPSITISSSGVLHKVHGKFTYTYAVKLKEHPTFAVTYTATNTGSATPTATLTLSRKGKSEGSLPMQAGTLSSGAPYFFVQVKFGKKFPTGHLVATFTITIGSTTATQSLNFTLKKK